MRSKVLAKVMGNAFVSKVAGTIGSFYISHESLILTTGTIGFSLATTAVTYKNAAKIDEALYNARCALAICNSEEEKKSIYKAMLSDLVKLVAPIIIFQSATIACALFSKKQYDKKLAEAAGALSIAQAAIAQYQNFTKEAQAALGEEEYTQLQEKVYSEQTVDGRRFATLPSEGGPGEDLFIDKYTGRPFWSTRDTIKMAAREMNRVISKEGEPVTIDDFHGFIGNADLTDAQNESLLAQRFGYMPGHDIITPHFADSHYVFPNGRVVQCAEVYLLPEPDYIDLC